MRLPALLVLILLLAACGDHRQAAAGARNIVAGCDAQEQGAPVAETRAAIKATALALARQLDPRGEVAASVPAAMWLEDDLAPAIEATQAVIVAIDEETSRQQWWRNLAAGAWDLVKGWWPPLAAAAGIAMGLYARIRKYRGALRLAADFGTQLAKRAKAAGVDQALDLKGLKQESMASQVMAGAWTLIKGVLSDDAPAPAPAADGHEPTAAATSPPTTALEHDRVHG